MVASIPPAALLCLEHTYRGRTIPAPIPARERELDLQCRAE
jgi:hypothetical protein